MTKLCKHYRSVGSCPLAVGGPGLQASSERMSPAQTSCILLSHDSDWQQTLMQC